MLLQLKRHLKFILIILNLLAMSFSTPMNTDDINT